MKYLLLIPFGLCGILLSPHIHAQDQVEKKRKTETIIIDGDKKEGNTTIEIKDGEVFIDGKKVDQEENGDTKIITRKKVIINGRELNDEEAEQFSFPFDGMDIQSNKPMLGVSTKPSATDDGAVVEQVVPNSPASKLGLMEGDVITKLNDHLIKNPVDLVEAVSKYKPGDRVDITFERNSKMLTKDVTLSERKDAMVMQRSFPMDEDFFKQFERMMPGMMEPMDRNFEMNGPYRSQSPKIGVSVEDRADGEGVQVNEVNRESAADKAGIQKDDVIVTYNSSAINNVDDLLDAIRNAQNKEQVEVEVKRSGTKKTLKLKVPKQLKKREL
ncbi:MAG: PDZ domain-containing protein [Chitinophagaceae bacterium]